MKNFQKNKFFNLSLSFDKNAKTPSFYLKKKPKKIDNTYIDFLKYYSEHNNHCDVRICLHENRKSSNHDMILLQNKKNYYRPHKHNNKGDTFHVIQGILAYFIFDDLGLIKNCGKLKKNELFRTEINEYHAILPITNKVIYHENKKGPFLKVRDSIFLKQSPKINDDTMIINNYKKLLISKLNASK